jgi:Cell wall synthesis protein CwsA
MSPPEAPKWPNLDPIAPPIEDLPENPTQAQVLRVLISTLLAFGHLWPRSVQALLYLKDAIERIERLPPMRRAEDTGSYIIETSRRVGERVGELARNKAQQIVDTPNIDLTPDAVGDIARTEAREAAREALAEERRINREKQLEAEHAAAEAQKIADAAAVEKKRLDDIEDAKTRARERRERNRLIIVGVVVGTVMLVIGGLYTFTWGRLTERQAAASEPPAVVHVPIFLPLPSAAASVPAAATGAPAAKKP